MDPLARFVAPDQVEVRSQGELPVLRLTGARSLVEVSPHGAHVLHWQPHGARPVLFISARSALAAGKPIRGGVPIVFPWFGPSKADPSAPPHGFARLRSWETERAGRTDEASCEVQMQLVGDAASLAQWPHRFEARFHVRADERLHLRFEVRNTGDAAFAFEGALHTYFAVSDVRQVAIRGLEHADYIDRMDGGRRKNQGGDPITFVAETDRAYLNTESTCTIDDPGWRRRIVVAKSGSRTTVVWNPWIAKARAMPDFGDDEWPAMVCVETANALENAVTLAPGAAHALEAVIAVEAR